MVKIEIVKDTTEQDLASTTLSNSQFIQDLVSSLRSSSRRNKAAKATKTIRDLAQSCAATSIQASWRGVLARRSREEKRTVRSIGTNVTLQHPPDAAALKIQNEWLRVQLRDSRHEEEKKEENINEDKCKGVRYEEDHGFTSQNNNILHSPQLDSIGGSSTSRLDLINTIYEECLQKHSIIVLKRMEMLSVLKAMGLLGQKEYEYLTKVELRDYRTDRTGVNLSFQLTLRGSMMEFQKDLERALKALTRILQTPRLGRGVDRMIKCSAHGTREEILNHVSLDYYAIRFLYKHEGVDSYSLELIEDFLLALGVKKQSIEDTKKIVEMGLQSHWTLLKFLKECADMEESSLMRIKLEIAREVVLNLSRWELSQEDINVRGDVATNRNDSVKSKDIEEASKLRREIELLNESVERLSRENEDMKLQLRDKREAKRTIDRTIVKTGCEPKMNPILEPQPKHLPTADKKVLKESKLRRTVPIRPKRTRSHPIAPKVYQMTTIRQDKQKEVHRVDIQFGNDMKTGKENTEPVRKRKTKKRISSSAKNKSNPRRRAAVKMKKKSKTDEQETRLKRRELDAGDLGSPKVVENHLPSALMKENTTNKVFFNDKLSYLGDGMDTVPDHEEREERGVSNSCTHRDDSNMPLSDTAPPSMFDETKDNEELGDIVTTTYERDEAMAASLRATNRLSELLERFRVSAMPP